MDAKIFIVINLVVNFYSTMCILLFSKINNPKSDGIIFSFDENVQTNTSETHTGRLIYRKNKIIEIVEKSIKTEDSKRLAGIYFFSR